MSNKKILITGSDGFIGSHLTEALVRAGHDVRAFVLYNSFNSWGWLDRCSSDVKGTLNVYNDTGVGFDGKVLSRKSCTFHGCVGTGQI